MVLLDSRSQASQWDYGLTVLFSADDGVVGGQEVHFARQGDDTAIVLLAEDRDGSIVCDVPNELLTEAKTIRIYAYVDNGTDGRTVKRWQLQVFARPRPEDYVYTPEEVKHWDALDALVADLDNRVTYIEEHGGSGGTTDYAKLSNKPSINDVELSGNKTAEDIGVADRVHTHTMTQVDGLDISLELLFGSVSSKYTKPSGGIPASDLAQGVQDSLSKAESALQEVPSTYRTASAQDAIDITKVATTDPRLSDARTPTAHTHSASDIFMLQPALTSLQTRTSALETATESLNENYVSLSERVDALETALIGVDTAINRLEGAI